MSPSSSTEHTNEPRAASNWTSGRNLSACIDIISKQDTSSILLACSCANHGNQKPSPHRWAVKENQCTEGSYEGCLTHPKRGVRPLARRIIAEHRNAFIQDVAVLLVASGFMQRQSFQAALQCGSISHRTSHPLPLAVEDSRTDSRMSALAVVLLMSRPNFPSRAPDARVGAVCAFGDRR